MPPAAPPLPATDRLPMRDVEVVLPCENGTFVFQISSSEDDDEEDEESSSWRVDLVVLELTGLSWSESQRSITPDIFGGSPCCHLCRRAKEHRVRTDKE